MSQLSIIFCYRNKDVYRVKNALESLNLQDNKDFQVLFVDYGSSESSSKEIAALCKNYTFCTYLYIDSQGKFWNRAEALNYGILNCNSSWIFTADVDLVFMPGFISRLHKEKADNEAKFFCVGYLNASQTQNLDLNALHKLSHTRSQDFALGMVLTSRSVFNKVNGYNMFYAIWGMEDNDLKARMDMHGIKTDFVQDVLMLHQYHSPASTAEGGMPEGWIAFSKDYFSSGGALIGLDKLVFPPPRPARDFKTDPDFISKKISGRILFIRHQLVDAIVNSREKKMVLVMDLNSHKLPQNTTTVKLIRRLNVLFTKLGIEAHAVSNFKEQYSSAREIRNEIYFAVKSFSLQLADHYIEESEDHITLAIVKF